jgi:hypothetical protein
MKKILITDAAHHVLVEGLTALGFVVDYKPEISVEEVIEFHREAITG